MADKILIVILGQTPAQKNDKRMAFNRLTGKPFPVTGKKTKDWQEDAYIQLKKGYKGVLESKTTIDYKFYVKDNRRRDTDNMVCTINDALVKAGLLKDDSWQCLKIGSADSELDRVNPRAEMWVKW